MDETQVFHHDEIRYVKNSLYFFIWFGIFEIVIFNNKMFIYKNTFYFI